MPIFQQMAHRKYLYTFLLLFISFQFNDHSEVSFYSHVVAGLVNTQINQIRRFLIANKDRIASYL
jgi:hypothetical protein